MTQSSSTPPWVMFSAGEASGDRYAARIHQRLTQQFPDLQAFGLGGRESRDAGIETLVAAEDIAVMGLIEVLRHYPLLRRSMNRLKAAMAERRPDLLICIDYQEFNQRLARHARSLGIPVLFFVAPQVWAWRPHRAARMCEVADDLAVLFPFEVELFAGYGIRTHHVGHPLVDMIDLTRDQQQARAALGLNADATVIGLLPGSRRSEIRRLLPVMLAAASALHARHPDWRFVLPIAHTLSDDTLAPWLADAPPDPVLRLVRNHTHDAIRAADMALVTSGTASLETAVIGTPMVITYKTSWLTYQLAKRMLSTPDIGLPNIVARQRIIPEVIQDQATAPRLAAEIEQLLHNPEQQSLQRQGLLSVREQLGSQGAIDNVARLAAEQLSQTLAG